MAIAACLFGIMKMQNKLQEERKRAKTAKATAESTERQRMNSITAFTVLQDKSRDQIAYYEQWKPYFKFYEGPAIDAEISTITSEDSRKLIPLSSRSNIYSYKDKHGIIKQVQRTTLKFVDNYATLFNWLGDIENDIKVSRVTSLRVSKATGDSEIEMQIDVDVPLLPPNTDTANNSST